MAKYLFIDHWYIKASIKEVFAYISDPSSYPKWWKVYSKVTLLPGPKPPHVGSKAELIVHSFLGYHLRLTVETIESDPPRYFKTIAKGNLEGTGVWEFKQNANITEATFTWIVETHHPILNFFEPIAKNLFAYSHKDASEKGQKGLKKLLEK